MNDQMAEKDIILKSLGLFKDAFPGRINQILKSKEDGKKIIGTLCLYVPDELIYACGAGPGNTMRWKKRSPCNELLR